MPGTPAAQQPSSLSQARTDWFHGEWPALAALEAEALLDHPERDRLVLLAASAHHQLGSHEEARRLARLALEWGCPPRLAAQVLIAGVYNTLGRAAALARDDARAARHFRSAMAVVGDERQATQLAHERSVREMVRLGLLPQAADAIGEEIKELSQPRRPLRPGQARSRIKVLEVELDLLQHEFSLALQRQQLYAPRPGEGANQPPLPGDAGWLKHLRRKSVSQLGQDLWVLEKTGYKRGGFFVEFGATDGVLLSNTWLLEKEFGWQGICAEPNPKLFEQLRRNRGCAVSDACVSGETGKEVEFIFADAYGGIADYVNTDKLGDRRSAYGQMGNKARLTTISLHDFLRRHNAPHEIDYLSVDTEGSELEILAAFPFEEWKINLLTVEHNFTPQRKPIRALLARHGYQCMERKWDDWFFRP